MVSILVGASLFWVFAVLCFFVGDIIKGIRSRKMSGYSIHSNTTAANISNGAITLGGNTTTSVTVNSPMQTTKELWVEDMNVGENIQLFRFFLQSRYPEVFEEFNAIEKIRRS